MLLAIWVLKIEVTLSDIVNVFEFVTRYMGIESWLDMFKVLRITHLLLAIWVLKKDTQTRGFNPMDLLLAIWVLKKKISSKEFASIFNLLLAIWVLK